jgi:hypothetical protein
MLIAAIQFTLWGQFINQGQEMPIDGGRHFSVLELWQFVREFVECIFISAVVA